MAHRRSSGKSSSATSAPTSARFTHLETTSDTLTGRAGLALFSRYLQNSGIYRSLERLFGPVRRSRKGLPVIALFHQLFCFLADGTSRHLTYFDALRQDEGYARGIETAPGRMASSHQIKRFFSAFAWGRIWLFRRLLRRLFLWRLGQSRPALVVLGLDTMVLDNDSALVREGCQPTYKKVKGFQPLQLTWERFVVDALFRGGKKHGNAGEAAGAMVSQMVTFLRNHYRADVAIVVRLDAGFFDQKLFRRFEKLGIGYTCSGKLLGGITTYAQALHESAWREYDNGHQRWSYVEFGDCRKDWKKTEWRRAFYTRPTYEDEQALLAFARPDHVIYTNLGQGRAIDTRLEEAGHAELTRPEQIIALHHARGRDELVHRALKDFRAEALPFKRFQSNAAFYYTVLLAFFLFECFKEDVGSAVVPLCAYPERVRRRLIDFAAKIVRTGGKTILKVSAATCERLRMAELWQRTADPPPIGWF